jgi:uncharacterized phiE125 gp8 family phage protein
MLMPTIQTAPPLIEPVTLAEAKAHLRVTHADDDTYISTLIKTARMTVEAQTGLALITQAWSVFLDDWPCGGIVTLPLFPVIDVVDIKVYGDDNTAAIIDPAHYYEDRTSRPSRIVLRGSRSWVRPGRVANGIEILLNVGFGATASTVPEPLREAVLQLVGHWYATRGDTETTQQPLQIAELLRPYRRARL